MKHTPEEIKQIIKDKVLGVIQPEHTASGHYYRFPNGILVTSVTGQIGSVISKPHLMKWAIRKAIEWLEVDERWRYLAVNTTRESYIKAATDAHTDVRDDAGYVGTQAHNAAEAYILQWIATGKQPKDIRDFFPYIDGRLVADSRAIAAARGLETLFNKHEVIPLASEILVGDPKISAGTLDFLCYWNGGLCLVDFKTSNQIDPISYSMQTAAYKKFFEKMTGLKIGRIRIIHLSKDSDKFSVYLVNKPTEAYKAFTYVAKLYYWIYEDDRPKVSKDIKRINLMTKLDSPKVDWKHLLDK